MPKKISISKELIEQTMQDKADLVSIFKNLGTDEHKRKYINTLMFKGQLDDSFMRKIYQLLNELDESEDLIIGCLINKSMTFTTLGCLSYHIIETCKSVKPRAKVMQKLGEYIHQNRSEFIKIICFQSIENILHCCSLLPLEDIKPLLSGLLTIRLESDIDQENLLFSIIKFINARPDSLSIITPQLMSHKISYANFYLLLMYSRRSDNLSYNSFIDSFLRYIPARQFIAIEKLDELNLEAINETFFIDGDNCVEVFVNRLTIMIPDFRPDYKKNNTMRLILIKLLNYLKDNKDRILEIFNNKINYYNHLWNYGLLLFEENLLDGDSFDEADQLLADLIDSFTKEGWVGKIEGLYLRYIN